MSLVLPHVVSLNPHNCPCCVVILNLQMRKLIFGKNKELALDYMLIKRQSWESTPRGDLQKFLCFSISFDNHFLTCDSMRHWEFSHA